MAGHTCKVIKTGSPGVGFDELCESIGKRVDAIPDLRRKLAGLPGAPYWTPDDQFDLGNHLGLYGEGYEVTNEELRLATAALFSERLDRQFPLWRIDVAPLADGGTALIWRIHHVLADGTTAMRLARQMLWDQSEVASSGLAVPTASGEPAGATGDGVDEAEHQRRRNHLLGLFEREFSRSHDPSPFDAPIGHERAISFATVPLQALHDSAKRLAGATLNDAVLNVVAGALRHWMKLHEQEIGGLKVRVPVSLHQGDDHAANNDSFFTISLPLGEPDPVQRLLAIRDATRIRKSDHDAEELDAILKRVSRHSPRLGDLLTRIESDPRRFAVSVSNVRGPEEAVSILGSPVETVHSIAEIGEHHALRIAALSVDDRLCFGFCADQELIADLDEMATGAELEAAAMSRL